MQHINATISPLQAARLRYHHAIPDVLNKSCKVESASDTKEVKHDVAPFFPVTGSNRSVKIVESDDQSARPLKVGVVLSGGQAPGGHNVIVGLFDGLKKIHQDSELIGFLGGPSGIIEQKTLNLTSDLLAHYRNQGGFHVIGSGRTKLDSPEAFTKAMATAHNLQLDAIVVIGGDDSNTNAANMAEYFKQNGSSTVVIGVPKTIDGDLKSEEIEISFGFHTACMVYSELIGNIETDCTSAKKYYHFIRLMGRAASHIALECALQTRPNMVVISEEIEAKNMSLSDVVNQIVEVVAARANAGKNYGVILIPEGLIDFIPEIRKLIAELNDVMANYVTQNITPSVNRVQSDLTTESLAVFNFLSSSIQEQLLMDRDPHGNVQVSRIETEKLLIECVERELDQRKKAGTFKGKFSALAHFFGYEGRCSLPTNFDSKYCYVLGRVASVLADNGCTGMMAQVSQTHLPVEQWIPGGISIPHMCGIERRHGHDVPVITKALVCLDQAPFQYLAANRESWVVEDAYRNPGPIQFWGPTADDVPMTLLLEKS
ncbi:hypothetical protein RCL1_008307 [Eukaryota sp. TZLM3-RCL]